MLAGTILGQMTFGFVADRLGRRITSLITAGLTILGALLCASVGLKSGREEGALIRHLCAWRFLLGVGVGGEYPVTAAAASEITQDPERRGRFMAATISCQGWGMLLSCVIALLAIGDGVSLEWTWRGLLGFGAIPSTVAFFLRWRLEESKIFSSTDQVESRRPASLGELRQYASLLIGTMSTWFCMNFALYSIGSFKSSIIGDALLKDESRATEKVYSVAWYSAITSFFAIGGFMCAFITINRFGRYSIQLYGFLALAGTFIMLAVLESNLRMTPTVFIWLIGQMFFFQNFGPNTTTYILSAEVYPSRVRGTCHGMSAACGKCGAVVGTFVLPLMSDVFGIWSMFLACAVAAIVGSIMTWACVPRSPPDYTAGEVIQSNYAATAVAEK
eukprot:TRINITY_DN14589_c0_g1_i2.p1 TRINITY_DN14589_c0_g1~~TRINITY_DN14589_c0_g1_i2.p1  ORF type:complete len:449 (-),score=55.89 TRINITY_DN14589_c0_g1_i2:87-1253(-)